MGDRELGLRRKMVFKEPQNGQRLVAVKRPGESGEHVYMKALLWAFFLPLYPGLKVERPIGDRYKPDLVAFPDAPAGGPGAERPIFWAECGKVRARKLDSILRRFEGVHLVVARWNDPSRELLRQLEASVRERRPRGPVEFWNFPGSAAAELVDAGGVADTRAAERYRTILHAGERPLASSHCKAD